MNGFSPKEAQDVLSMAEILEIPGFDMMQGILEEFILLRRYPRS